MTQAITLSETVQRAGGSVVGVVIGASPTRSLPAFVETAFPVPVTRLASPNFVMQGNRAVSPLGTAAALLRHAADYRRSFARLQTLVDDLKPDLIVNFYEPLMGLLNLFQPPGIPTLAVAHQFMVDHPAYRMPVKMALKRRALALYNALIATRSVKAALSFYPAPDLPGRRVHVCPPLLRRQLRELTPTNEGFLLLYLLNHGYAAEVLAWHREHPEVELHCFYDKPGEPEEKAVDATLTFHRLHGEKFLQRMARCDGVVCTAGFETLCEAAYLGKRLLVVPVQNQFEQEMNAIDVEQSGLGLGSTRFDLTRLLNSPRPAHHTEFSQWVRQTDAIFLGLMEETVGRPALTTPLPAAAEVRRRSPYPARILVPLAARLRTPPKKPAQTADHELVPH